MNILPLTKIGFFNPGRLTDEEIEQSYISRIPFFEYLFQRIIEEPKNSIPQHYLVIGQRGMGKTTLLLRIAAELRKQPYKKTFIALNFPEEQYNIDRLSKFWLNCLDALADALDKESNKNWLNELDRDISILTKEHNIDPNKIYEKFKVWCTKIERRPILLVDNLNLILNKISKEEAHQLRAILISNNAPILVGTSINVIEETVEYTAPFYDAFQISYLKKLSFAESIEVLQNLGTITGNKNFAKKIVSNKGRLQAIYQLTGGTPRTLGILFPFVQNGFSESIQTDLDALLDAITPLYKAKFEELSAQLQIVLDAIAFHWDPINLEQLRNITALENATLTPQLKRLVDSGWLQKLDAYNAKGNAYELTERFFNVWYLLRRSNRRQKRKLYCLTKFLESFYGNDLENIAQKRLKEFCITKENITVNLALAEAIKDVSVSKQLKNNSYETKLDLSNDNSNVLNDLNVPYNYKLNKGNELINDFVSLNKPNKYVEATEKLLAATRYNKHNPYVWCFLGIIYQYYLEKYEDAENAYNNSIAIDGSDYHIWNALGNLYQNNLLNNEKAEKAYLKALEIDVTNNYTKYSLTFLWRDKMNKIPEAKELFNTIQIDKELIDSHFLNQALFAFYDKNIGIGLEFIKNALKVIEDKLPVSTQNDWYRTFAIILKLGYGNELLNILKEGEINTTMRPFYVAIEALIKKEVPLFLNSIAVEVREPARKIIEFIERYLK